MYYIYLSYIYCHNINIYRLPKNRLMMCFVIVSLYLLLNNTFIFHLDFILKVRKCKMIKIYSNNFGIFVDLKIRAQ